MDQRLSRITSYVRDIARRDGRTPDSFVVRSPFDTTPMEGRAFGVPFPGNSRDFVPAKVLESRLRPPLSVLGGESRPRSSTTERPASARVPQVEIPPSAAISPDLTITPEAADAFQRVLGNKPVSVQDATHLESLILPALRPAFDIVDETYAELPGDWDPWNQVRAAVEPLLRGIGRLQLTGHPSFTLVGTGFVCGPNAILTNRHVAQIFVQGIGSGNQLSFSPGVTCAMEMLAEVGSPKSLPLSITQPIVVSSLWDLALLCVDALPTGVAPLPLAGAAPTSLDGAATIVGYPSYDPYESFIDQANIFRAVFDRKRFQPGRLNGRVDVSSFGHTVSAIAHDCSTLGGNSGSALISSDPVQVVGIHFSGITHVSNYAIPSWELKSDPAFAGQHFNFV